MINNVIIAYKVNICWCLFFPYVNYSCDIRMKIRSIRKKRIKLYAFSKHETVLSIGLWYFEMGPFATR